MNDFTKRTLTTTLVTRAFDPSAYMLSKQQKLRRLLTQYVCCCTLIGQCNGNSFLKEHAQGSSNLHQLKFYALRTEVRGDFNIHGTKNFQNAVFLQKSNIYDVVSLLNLWWTKKTCSPHEILTQLASTENTFFRCFQY